MRILSAVRESILWILKLFSERQGWCVRRGPRVERNLGRVPGVTHLQCCPLDAWEACAVRTCSLCVSAPASTRKRQSVWWGWGWSLWAQVWSLWAPWFWVEVFLPPSISSSGPGAQPEHRGQLPFKGGPDHWLH